MMNTRTLEKHIVGENGIGYTLGADGLYYPDLKLPEGTHYETGRYGRMRSEYLKTYRRGDYICPKNQQIKPSIMTIICISVIMNSKNKGGCIMALIKCPECGKEVSSSANSCPNCGYDIKTYCEDHPMDVYKTEHSEIYVDCLTRKRMSMFENGIEYRSSGKCVEHKAVFDYYVEADKLYVKRWAGTAKYIITDKYLINIDGRYEGNIPEENMFNAECSSKSLLGKGTCIIVFHADGTFTKKEDGLVGTTGIYLRKGNLLATRSRDTGNEAYGSLIYNNNYYSVGSLIKKSEMIELKKLCDELDSMSFNPEMIGKPAKNQNIESVSVTCPYCNSNNTSKIGIVGRSLSFGLFGFGSSKVGKQWHCNKCGSNF